MLLILTFLAIFYHLFDLIEMKISNFFTLCSNNKLTISNIKNIHFITLVLDPNKQPLTIIATAVAIVLIEVGFSVDGWEHS